MFVQKDLTGKPKEFLFGSGLEPKKPRGITNPHDDTELQSDKFGGLKDDR